MTTALINNIKGLLDVAQNTQELLVKLSDPNTLINELTKGKSDPFVAKLINQSLPCMLNETRRLNSTSVQSVVKALINDCILKTLLGQTDDAEDCNVDEEEAVIKGTLVSIAVLMLIMLSCCFKSRKRYKTSCCGGRPAPVVPLNMLDQYEGRVRYMLTFGVTINSCVDVLLGDYARVVGTPTANKIATTPKYLSVLIKIGLALFICVIAYPLFIAQNMRNRLFGSILGFLYSFLYFILLVNKHVVAAEKCWAVFERENQRQRRILLLFQDLPRLACLVALQIIFLYYIIQTLYRRRLSNSDKNYLFQEDKDDWKESYMYIHVKHVCRKHIIKKQMEEKALEELTFKQKFKNFFKAKAYEVKPGFKYSTKMMVATFVSILAVYLVILNLCLFGYLIFVKLWNQLLNQEAIIYIAEKLNVPINTVQKHVDGLQASWWLAIAFSAIIYTFVLMNSLTWYRRHVLMLRAGNRSFLPSSIKKGSLDSGSLMNACLKFAGFQVGYAAWGYLINFIVFWLLTSLLSALIVVPLFYGGPAPAITLIKGYWLTAVVGFLSVIIQGQFAKRCFLIGEENVSVDNRRAFHVMSYIFFYFNVFIGVVSCILRIVYGFILGLIFLPRLPKSTLPRSYERRDPGFLAYLGFLLVEHQHSNPVLQCFVRILLYDANKDMNLDEYTTIRKGNNLVENISDITDNPPISSIEKFETRQKKRARNRWHLFVMLVQNPSIRKYRARYFKRRFTAKHLTKAFMTMNPFNEEENALENSPLNRACTDTKEKLEELSETRQTSLELDDVDELDDEELDEIKETNIDEEEKNVKHNHDNNVVWI